MISVRGHRHLHCPLCDTNITKKGCCPHILEATSVGDQQDHVVCAHCHEPMEKDEKSSWRRKFVCTHKGRPYNQTKWCRRAGCHYRKNPEDGSIVALCLPCYKEGCQFCRGLLPTQNVAAVAAERLQGERKCVHSDPPSEAVVSGLQLKHTNNEPPVMVVYQVKVPSADLRDDIDIDIDIDFDIDILSQSLAASSEDDRGSPRKRVRCAKEQLSPTYSRKSDCVESDNTLDDDDISWCLAVLDPSRHSPVSPLKRMRRTQQPPGAHHADGQEVNRRQLVKLTRQVKEDMKEAQRHFQTAQCHLDRVCRALPELLVSPAHQERCCQIPAIPQ